MFSQKNNQTANKSIESSEIKYKWTFKFSKKIKKEGGQTILDSSSSISL